MFHFIFAIEKFDGCGDEKAFMLPDGFSSENGESSGQVRFIKDACPSLQKGEKSGALGNVPPHRPGSRPNKLHIDREEL